MWIKIRGCNSNSTVSTILAGIFHEICLITLSGLCRRCSFMVTSSFCTNPNLCAKYDFNVLPIKFCTDILRNCLLCGRWLRGKSREPCAIEALFRAHADSRLRTTMTNPVFSQDRSRLASNANEAFANMMAIEKCDIVIMNPLFGSGLPLPYKPVVRMIHSYVLWLISCLWYI